MKGIKKAGFYTLGCKLNFSETSTIARSLSQAGIVRAEKGESADIYIINTCSVTEQADKKCRNLIRRIVRENPQAIVAVTGCYAQLKPYDLAQIEGVDLVIGNNEKGSLADRVREIAGKGKTSVYTCETSELTSFFSSYSTGERTRAFLKVQDGCDYRCSYCTIPLARGASRNIPIAQVVEEARGIAAKGVKEIVLTGINTGDFGKTTGETFLSLLRELEKVDGIRRYRISSIEPNLLTDEIIDFTAGSEKFMAHFHIPLQSGCDRILGLMRRRYTTRTFAERIARAREAIPDVFVGIDLITGFPGETPREFEATCDFLRSVEPAFLHVFPYSARPNTPAAGFPGRIAPEEAARRVKILSELSAGMHARFMERYVGTEAKVLIESTRRGGMMFGYTGNYIKAEVPYDREFINRIVRVRLGGVGADGQMTANILRTDKNEGI